MIKNRSPYSWLFSLSGYLLAHLYSPLMDALWVYLCWHNPNLFSSGWGVPIVGML